jgi:C-lobe and N-lobe beta barrels of Tf-binding protein B
VTRSLTLCLMASLVVLSACKPTSDGTGTQTLGSLASQPTEPGPVKNSNLVTPTVQESFTTFSANQRIRTGGEVSPRVTVNKNPDGSFPQAATNWNPSLPADGYTFKPTAVLTQGVVYEGSQPIGSSTELTIDFNPRDAVYSVTAKTASIDNNTRLQDPAHRTTFQQQLVPTLSTYRYAQGEGGATTTVTNARNFNLTASTIFVHDVGTGAGQQQYVTIGGYVVQKYTEVEVTKASTADTLTIGVDFTTDINRSVFAYGVNTAASKVPTSGTATFRGDMLIHAIITPQLFPTGDDHRTISGTSTTTVDFATGKVGLSLNGAVVGFIGDTRSFSATGSADFVKAAKDTDPSRFAGKIDSWSFGYAGTAPAGAVGSSYNLSSAAGNIAVPTAASSIEGGFFGPAANEVGGAFRIIGQRTDERIDFLGAFIGSRN